MLRIIHRGWQLHLAELRALLWVRQVVPCGVIDELEFSFSAA